MSMQRLTFTLIILLILSPLTGAAYINVPDVLLQLANPDEPQEESVEYYDSRYDRLNQKIINLSCHTSLYQSAGSAWFQIGFQWIDSGRPGLAFAVQINPDGQTTLLRNNEAVFTENLTLTNKDLLQIELDRINRTATASLNGQPIGPTVTAIDIDHQSDKPRLVLAAWKSDDCIIASFSISSITIDYKDYTSETLSPYSLDVIPATPMRSRLIESIGDAAGQVAIIASDEYLDLHNALKLAELNNPPRQVSFGPIIVAGQGAHPDNHTLVRILDRYQVIHNQFLAYPPEVRGGVDVAVGELEGSGWQIATVPLRPETTHEIRLFNELGGLIRTFNHNSTDALALKLETGRFLNQSNYACIALPAANPTRIIFYDSLGNQLRETPLSDWTETTLALARVDGPARDRLLVYNITQQQVALLNPDGTAQFYPFPDTAAITQLSPDAFNPNAILASLPDDTFSRIDRYTLSATDLVYSDQLNIGERENTFWFLQGCCPLNNGDGNYVKQGLYRHLRVDHADYLDQVSAYDTDPAALWEPTYSHREFPDIGVSPGNFKDIAGDITGQTGRPVVNYLDTGLPRYYMLGRYNHTETITDVDSQFLSKTYALNDPNLDTNLNHNLTINLSELAARHRANPEHFVGVEPNHEFKIPNGLADNNYGDYNPLMIIGFHTWLIGLYGDMTAINARFDTPFTTRFDAPRNLNRGPWDSYDVDNPFFMAWLAYNRYVINRRIADTCATALALGFAPETITTHQIPDNFTFRNHDIDPVNPLPDQYRITPVDFAAASETNFGITRYGNVFNRVTNIFQAAYTSGYHQWGLGEYSLFDGSATDHYQQLQYLLDHGLFFAHMMAFDTEDQISAMQMLRAENAPRRGSAGGVGQLRPCALGDQTCNIARIGADSSFVGLLKSLDANGDWDGVVYCVPFRSQIDIQTIDSPAALTLTDPVTFEAGRLEAGSQYELSFTASAAAATLLTIAVEHDGVMPADMQAPFTVNAQPRHYRFILRGQLALDHIKLHLTADSPTELSDLLLTRQQSLTFSLAEERLSGQPHPGGFEYDIVIPHPTCQNLLDSGQTLPMDLSGPAGHPDCRVDLYDLALLSAQWQQSTPTATMDIPALIQMTTTWLTTNDPAYPY